MRKIVYTLFLFVTFSFVFSQAATAQCSICTRTAQQLGEKPAKGLNAGIIYLAFTPIVIISVVGYKWYRRNN
ncbi:MAG TPA: hypothetical protein VHK91_03040 [Flavisolibacter sp.]|nr:hypothetical protein [Flavisolibacter sp.]